MNEQILAQARQIYSAVLPMLFRRRNVVACGLGYKIRGTEHTCELSLIVSVTEKLPPEALAPQDMVPKTVDGMSTDVVETGKIRAFMSPLDPKARYRPAFPGISIGHYEEIKAGTLGPLVRRAGEVLILSNNHVLADVNDGQLGDPIYQPGPLDGGTANERLGVLADFVPLDFGEVSSTCRVAEGLTEVLNVLSRWTGSPHRLQAIKQTSGENLMDVALARPDDPEMLRPEILGIGMPIGMAEPQLGMPVQKSGRTTGLTQGFVEQIDVTVNVDYNGRMACFTNQIITNRMSAPGDSGSAILDTERRVVGLLFAGSEHVTIFTPIQRILTQLGLELVTA